MRRLLTLVALVPACVSASFGSSRIVPEFTSLDAGFAPKGPALVIRFKEEGLDNGQALDLRFTARVRVCEVSGKTREFDFSETKHVSADDGGTAFGTVTIKPLPDAQVQSISFSNIRVQDLTQGLDGEVQGGFARRFTVATKVCKKR